VSWISSVRVPAESIFEGNLIRVFQESRGEISRLRLTVDFDYAID